MVKRGLLSFAIALLVVFSAFSVLAQTSDFTHVISNSEDWRDVYSIMHYSKLKNVGKDFLVSPRHGPVLLRGISKENDILVISSDELPFSLNYGDYVDSQGYRGVEEIVLDSANLELIDDLPEVNNYVVVGDTYGYSAISAAPYAVSKNAWVFFANRINVDEIDFILENRDVDELLIYGFVDREVRDTLAVYDPVIIDTGDRFDDNIEILKRQAGDDGPQQILLTNGEFIENELMSGAYPILFTGKENVPDQIADYIKGSSIEVAVLVGADLVGAATNIRRTTGISVIVKFARGARNPTGALAAVEGLDLFYLPIPITVLEIASAKFNRATSNLELTYKSDSNVPVFFKGTITPVTEDGDRTRIGDVDPIFIGPGDFKTVSYPDIDYTGGDLTLEVSTLFGQTPSALDKILTQTVDVEITDVIDGCDINILGVEYRKPKDSFAVIIENLGTVDCWVDVELDSIFVDSSYETLGSEGATFIAAGKKKRVYVPQLMTDEDLAENSLVEVIAYYGEREDGKSKIVKGKFPLQIVTISLAMIGLYSLIIIVIIAIILLLIMFWRRRREEDDFDDF